MNREKKVDKILKLVQKSEIIIFDFDGTLINSEPCHLKAHNKVLKKLLGENFELTREVFVSRYCGKTDNEIFGVCYKKDFGIEYNTEEQKSNKIKFSNEFLADESVKIFDYFFELLKIKDNKKFYIVSNQDGDVLNFLLEKKHIKANFNKVFALPNIGVRKRDFLKNLDQYIPSKGKQVVLFEDNLEILELAKELGFFVVGVETENNRGRLVGKFENVISYWK